MEMNTQRLLGREENPEFQLPRKKTMLLFAKYLDNENLSADLG